MYRRKFQPQNSQNQTLAIDYQRHLCELRSAAIFSAWSHTNAAVTRNNKHRTPRLICLRGHEHLTQRLTKIDITSKYPVISRKTAIPDPWTLAGGSGARSTYDIAKKCEYPALGAHHTNMKKKNTYHKCRVRGMGREVSVQVLHRPIS